MMKNKKAELRIHNLFIAVMVFSLFTVVLYSGITDDEKGIYGEGGFNFSRSEYINASDDGNASGLFEKLDIVTSGKNDIIDMADSAPGGIDSTAPEDSSTTDGTLQKSGYSLVTKAGIFLFSIPKLLIMEVSTFLHIDPVFATVGSAILILIVAIILVSSVLRNRI